MLVSEKRNHKAKFIEQKPTINARATPLLKNLAKAIEGRFVIKQWRYGRDGKMEANRIEREEREGG